MAERDRRWIAAVLAANAELEAIAHLPPAVGRDANELTDAFAVDRDERVDRQNALRLVRAEEARGVVARNAERGLRQIVGAEREELRGLADLAGLETRARQLDHGADLVVDLGPGLLRDGLRHRVD